MCVGVGVNVTQLRQGGPGNKQQGSELAWYTRARDGGGGEDGGGIAVRREASTSKVTTRAA